MSNSDQPPSGKKSVLAMAARFEQTSLQESNSNPLPQFRNSNITSTNSPTANSPTSRKKPPPPPPPKPKGLLAVDPINGRMRSISATDTSHLHMPPPLRNHLSHSSPNLSLNSNDLAREASSANNTQRPVKRPPPELKPRPPSMYSPDNTPSVVLNNTTVISRNQSNASISDDLSEKRFKIICEIIETEKSYLNDLQVLDQIFGNGMKDIIPPQDWKLLFGHLVPVMQVSSDLLNTLQANFDPANQVEFIGYSFNQHMKAIEVAYCNYCKYNEAALQKIQEWTTDETNVNGIKTFLEESRARMQGRTNAWDLSSMVVKPVQRVLKYPLLLKRLLENCDAAHADFENLTGAFGAMEDVAELINEVKKRKDIVEKYVQGKGSVNVLHGISKKWNRGTQLLKNVTGTSGVQTTDEYYNSLLKHFEFLQLNLPAIEKSVQTWIKTLKEYLEQDISFTTLLEEEYVNDRSGMYVNYYQMVRQYRQSRDQLLAGPWNEVVFQSKKIIKLLATLQEMFRKPTIIIKKRESKRLDHDRVLALKLRDEKVEKDDQESADAFVSINSQLCEELPLFFGFVQEYLGLITMEIINMKSTFYQSAREIVYPLYQKFVIDDYDYSNRIIPDYKASMTAGREIEKSAREIKLLRKWCDSVWGEDGESNSLTRQSSIQSAHASPRFGSSSLAPHLIDITEVGTTPLSQSASNIYAHQDLSTLSFGTEDRFYVTAQYHFEAEMQEELTLYEGDVILVDGTVERNGSSEWWYGSNDHGQSGWFPCNFVVRG